jgi:hypothetical protein
MNNKRILIIALAILSQQAIQAKTVKSNSYLYSNKRGTNESNCNNVCGLLRGSWTYQKNSAYKGNSNVLVCECVKK